MWVTQLSIVDWVHSKTQILLATLRTRNQPREGIWCVFGSRTFVAISWMCEKQTSVSHSSAESELISLDAGQRMDGLLALDLWVVIIEVLRSTNNTSLAAGNCSRGTTKPKQKGNWDVDLLSDVGHVPTNAHSSQGESQLHIFEDNEAVIKKIIEGRSPTMRHVPSTHRVAFGWLFDRINLDPKIQIKYVDIKSQLTDMFTKRSFTRDEWNHLFRLLKIMNFSMFSCSHFFLSNGKQRAMSERSQDGTPKEGSAMAKPRPMNLVSRNLLSTKKDSPRDMSDSNSPLNAKVEHGGVSAFVWKLTRHTSQNPAMYSQVR